MAREVIKTAEFNLNTPYGMFRAYLYTGNGTTDVDHPTESEHHLALTVGDLEGKTNVLVRISSRCLLGETFGGLECECAPQLHDAMKRVQEEGQGVILYLMQEGKNIGLVNKAKAIQRCQETGVDMYDAFIALGFRPDERDYSFAAAMLRDLGVGSPIRLITNSPDRITQLGSEGFEVVREPSLMGVTMHNAASLTYKRIKMGHMLGPT